MIKMYDYLKIPIIITKDTVTTYNLLDYSTSELPEEVQ